MNCLLCQSDSTLYASDVFLCAHCSLVFKNPSLHLKTEEDIKRYSSHQNNENDQGYVDFLNRLAIPLTPFLSSQFSALDFGCGPGPTLALMLKELGGSVENYDPIFFPNQELLTKKYDVVTSTEVVEHFKNPEKDWALLVDRVKPGGLLGIMTQFLNSGIDYQSWWYKNDPTHVAFYQEKTFDFLADKFNLTVLFNDKNSVIIFRKK